MTLSLRQFHCEAKEGEDHRLSFASPRDDDSIVPFEDLERGLKLPFVGLIAKTTVYLPFQFFDADFLLEPWPFLL